MSSVYFAVSSGQSGQRLDQAVTDYLHDQNITRARAQAWIKAGRTVVNGQVCARPARRLAEGETVHLDIPNPAAKLTPEAGDLGVVYQDEQLVVLNKPAGLVVHPAPGLNKGTLVHRLLHQFPVLERLDGARPGIVHRLDKDTTGLLVVALDESARLKMAAEFAARRVEKTYLALVHGAPAKALGVIDAPIGRHPVLKTRMAVVRKGGRQALSEYRVLWVDAQNRFSLLQVRIQTGRTHQIRTHLQHLGHPLLGDLVYSSTEARAVWQNQPWADKLLRRPLLHAWRIGLTHPRTAQRLRFQVPPPKDFRRAVLVCSRALQRVGLTGLPGCGKSVLLAELSRSGLPAWSADAVVRELYNPGQDGWELLHRRFGTRFVPDEAGVVDTTALLAAMRESPALRREVEEIMHPLTAHRLEAFWMKHAASRAALAEVPLLLESGWRTEFDVLAGLFCPDHLRRQWLEASRGWDQGVLADVESWQWSGPDKLRACGLVVENPGTLDGMRRQAAALSRVLQWLRRQKTKALDHRLNDLFASPAHSQ